MRLRVPPGCGAVSHAGRAIGFDDEYVDVDENIARALLAHGFAACEVEAQSDAPQSRSADRRRDDIGALNRRELFGFLKAKGVSVCLPVTNEELRTLARRAIAENAFDPSGGANEELR